MPKQRLYGYVRTTALHPAGPGWLVVVHLGRRRVVRVWVSTREKAAEQLREADAMRPLRWPEQPA